MVKYQLKDSTDPVTNCCINSGEYIVYLSFENTGDFDWLSYIDIDRTILFKINKKQISLTYDKSKISVETKEYFGSSDYNDLSRIYNLLQITDGNKLNIKYSSLLSNGSTNLKIENAKEDLSIHQ